MRILLINPLSGFLTGSMNLGLGYIASFLQKQHYEVCILDRVPIYYKNNEDIEKTDRQTESIIRDFCPDYIGLTMTTVQFSDAQHVIKIIRKIKKLSNVPIIVGGYHPTAEPELTLMQCPEIDVAVLGEGEKTLAELIARSSPKDTKGIIFKRGNSFISTDERSIEKNLDPLPFPARELFDYQFYFKSSSNVFPNYFISAATQITSRGCPGRCKFCASGLIDQGIRTHSVEYVIAEIQHIIENYNVQAISFVDTMFLSKWSRVERLCHRFIELSLNKRIRWGASVRADFVTEDKLRLMKEAGCVYLNYGFESGSQRMLDLMNKKVSVKKNYLAAQLTRKVGMMADSAFIVGLPGETKEDIFKTVEFIKKTNLFATGLNILAALPGSAYYKELVRDKVVNGSISWEKVGRSISAPSKVKDLLIFNQIPPAEFLKIITWINYNVISPRNLRNYIKKNWFRDPKRTLQYVKFLLRYITFDLILLILKGEKRDFKEIMNLEQDTSNE